MRRPWALPLVPVYWGAVRGKNALFDLGWRRGERLGWPVVSVGSLSAGGAGKTPVVMMLAELLGRRGVGVDVLSRGYGRGSGVVEEVSAEGEARRFGDEPLEMARRGLRVFVGVDRVAAGRLAEASTEADSFAALRDDNQVKRAVHLLDDGFQHRRLGRDLDVVLLTREDVGDWMLPAGNLREPLSALGRADVIVVREDEPGVLAAVDMAPTRAEVWVIRRELVLPEGRPKRPLVFCGIARPEGLLGMVAGAAGTKVFADHHAYEEEDFAMLVRAAERVGADGFVTTAKDAVKISGAAKKMLEEVGPVVVRELRVSLVNEERAWKRLERVLGKGEVSEPQDNRLAPPHGDHGAP